ncbi:MAG: hypothetical protein JJE50_11430 [Actinomycetales bacterium]|nr:hypothetical protein [Actinomycetales bacterium]
MDPEPAPHTPFRPGFGQDPPHPMPTSVPAGLRLELSRARLLPGKGPEFEEWMQMLHERYAQCQETLPAERAAFEATFRHTEADGSEWMYHVSVVGEGGSGLDTSIPLDAAHESYARRVKEGGWEELTPAFMLGPQPLLDAMARFGRTGEACRAHRQGVPGAPARRAGRTGSGRLLPIDGDSTLTPWGVSPLSAIARRRPREVRCARSAPRCARPSHR